MKFNNKRFIEIKQTKQEDKLITKNTILFSGAK